ncbi:MAG: hypothetical protein UV68_C0049G0003 [Candidatus Collierbacteria bacterium GW2011_GWC2_43_12]|uniref:Uncharacterized protein n=1 Tax=Candidatus Collierbacteria bacterium GW2011_GWC2_43_12 TaxID=1618390 RepID=A0A0G1D3G9_9BACT|nr:MAG: hypothetical protein UV68_C0049G0003 [Candidatus Collierbacteria bacterium GW2011_GWC2_43_12]KKT82377.1 MAG: hypothetical protein UW80_C0038G0002 [Microgenomates group bacterium GW2011_GWC1_44_9]
METEGLREAEGLKLGDSDGLILVDGERDEEGLNEAEGLRDGLTEELGE